MKIRRWVTLLGAVVVIAAAAALFTNLFGAQLIDGLPLFRLQTTTTYASSTVTLEQVRELYSFTAVEYVHRTVFPYDYLPGGVSLNEILRTLRTTEATVRATLTDDEYLYFQTYNLATDLGLNNGGEFDFVVVTVIYSAGFDLSGLEDQTPFEIHEFRDPEGQSRRRIELVLPAATITSVEIDDIDADDYPYPDAAVGAEGLSRIASFVLEQPLAPEEENRVLEAARAAGAQFVTELLSSAGYDEVVIR